MVSILLMVAANASTPKPLQIYFIDVEGGQSTLLVTPSGQSLLVDTGWAGEGTGFHPGDPHAARDANRIVAAVHDAGLSKIDYLLITHFHSDHDGGVGELAQLLPIHTFIDHGAPSPEAESTSAETKAAFEAYARVRGEGDQQLEPHPGEHLPLKGLEVTVVSSAGVTLAAPLAGVAARNPMCSDQATPPRDPYENPRSTGILVRYGRFRFLDVGDLSGKPLFNLVCPRNLIGPVEAYLVAHHGGADVADPAILSALAPRVAIQNNGVTKGGARLTYEALHHVPGLENVWQLHTSADAGDLNFPAEYIANLDESTAHWIKLEAESDGSFAVLNGRTGKWKRYAPR
jgi:beta-lactamase superfamily II metal-dependent hydrolase